MIEKNQKTRKRSQVFLSYASADRDSAREIASQLINEGLNVWFDQFELQPEDSITSVIEQVISASDYLIVLLSPNSVNSTWVNQELNLALEREFKTRDITLLPILLEDCDVPSNLASRQYLDFRTNFQQGIRTLIEQIGLVPDIDFSKLNARSFEELVFNLLQKLGFKEIEKEWRIQDRSIDIKANFYPTDPFGAERKETWLVETKFYRESRADLKTIHQLTGYLASLPESFKGLLVTNGQITSAANQWLESIESQRRIEIRVLDGTDLKRLLLQHNDLVNKFFGINEGH